MRIHGTVRANLLAAIASARRLKGCAIHADTVDHWRQLVTYGRLVERQPLGEPVADLVAELETELLHVKAA